MRRRYRYDEELKMIVEIGADFDDAPRRAQTNTEELVYGGARTTDGVDISSRKKHREYLKASGLTVSSDYASGNHRKAREESYLGKDESRRADVARAVQEAKKRR